MKAKPVVAFIPGYDETQVIGYQIKCPGCKHTHTVYTNPLYSSVCWGYNGNQSMPTFTPSLRVTTGSLASPGFVDPEGVPPTCCHSFITDGAIQYCSDSTHELKGQTVELPEVE
jgi:hypothetical protein